jgi:hypothetical protein
MHDAFGNERDGLEPSDASAIVLDLQDGESSTVYNATLLGSGRVRVDYTPTKIGAHPLRVVVNEVVTGSSIMSEVDVVGSPFTVTISPAAPSGVISQANGEGCVTAVAGEPATVFLHVRDAFDNECIDGGDDALLRLDLRRTNLAVGESGVIGRVQDLQDGHGGYVATYTATVAGETWCNVTLLEPGGLSAQYFSNALPATTEQRYGYVAPLLSKVDLMIAFSGTRAVDGVSVMWPDLASLGDGLTFAGVWQGVVRAQHSELYRFYLSTSDGARMWISESKFISAWPIASRQTSSASLRLEAGQFYAVRIEFTRDPQRRPILDGSESPLLRLEWSSPSTARSVVPSTQLFHLVPIGVGGTRLVDVRPAAVSPPHSTVSGTGISSAVAGVPAHIELIARDAFGNQRRAGNDTVRAIAHRVNSTSGKLLYAGNGATLFEASIRDNQDGSYALDYTAQETGVYLLAITMNSNTTLAGELHEDQGVGSVAGSLRPFHINGSPFIVHIVDGATFPLVSDCTPADVDGPLYRAVAGTESTFVLQLRDAFGNARAGIPLDATVSVVAELDAAASVGSADNAAVADALTVEVS